MHEEEAGSRVVRVGNANQSIVLRATESPLIARGRKDALQIATQLTVLSDRLFELRRQAEQGDREAQYELATALRVGYLERNTVEAQSDGSLMDLLKLVLAPEGTDAERDLKRKRLEALKLRRAASEEAGRRLRAIKQDLDEAVEWLRRAAGQGHLYALSDLGDMYLSGEGVEQNPSVALRCYSVAAADDLDHGYWDGDCGAHMLERAADLGHAKSRYLHGANMHYLCKPIEAHMWLSLAIASGKLEPADQLDASRRLAEVRARISTDLVAQANSRMLEWMRTLEFASMK